MPALRRASVIAVISLAACSAPAAAQSIGYWFDTPSSPLSVTDLGPVIGVGPVYGGICFKPGDPNILLIAGNADSAASQIMAVPVIRDGQGHVSGFGPAVFFADAPGLNNGGLDGALVVGPNNVLFYSTFPDNTLGQIKPGSTAPDKLIDLTAIGITPSTGGVVFIPPGLPEAGQMRIVSWTSGQWYHANFTPDGSGTWDVSGAGPSIMTMGGGPEAMLYVPSNTPGLVAAGGYSPTFGWVIVSKYGGGRVDIYDVDAQGDPLINLELPLIDGIPCAEGMALDPLNGDLFVSSFGCPDRIVRLTGLGLATPPCPGDLNGDGLVDGADLAGVLGNWGGAATGDLNGDGVVNGSDLAVVLGAWGSC